MKGRGNIARGDTLGGLHVRGIGTYYANNIYLLFLVSIAWQEMEQMLAEMKRFEISMKRDVQEMDARVWFQAVE